MLVSVIIPVKNGEQTLFKCLAAIKAQTIFKFIEVIVIDSMSTDNSVLIAKTFGAKVISVKPSDFNHGLTRNLGVHHSNGKLLYFTVQDAELSCESTLENMVTHFENDEIQAVVGIQGYPHHMDKNPALWFKRFDSPAVESRFFPNGSFEKIDKKLQFELSNWDNVNAMYRKSALLDLPFPETNFSEDWIWANKALKSGKHILRDPSILVWHYHHMTFSYTLKSKFIINYYFKQFFDQNPKIGISPVPFLRRCYTLIFKRSQIGNLNKLYWIWHNLNYFLGNFISVFLFNCFEKLFGKNGLDWLYARLCKHIPQGKIKMFNHA
jgi:rhamnosyltransferase